MLDKEKDVQGIAMYSQWRKPGNMLQVLITPDGYGLETERLIPASVYRRVTSTFQQKRQWRGTMFVGLTHTAWTSEEKPLVKDTPLDPLAQNVARDIQESIVQSRVEWTVRMLESIHEQNWEMVGSPLFVETSKKDMDDIAVGKTPAKLMYRVNQLRGANEFPMNAEH